MGVVRSEEGVLKLVYKGGVVETHRVPVLAGDVLEKHPRHCVARPDVFTNPWIVVRPESLLRPGDVFYIVSYRTLRSLFRICIPPPALPITDRKVSEIAIDQGGVNCLFEPLHHRRRTGGRLNHVDAMNQRGRHPTTRRNGARTSSPSDRRLGRLVGCMNLTAAAGSSCHRQNVEPRIRPSKSNRVHSSSDTDGDNRKVIGRGHGDRMRKVGIRGPLKPCLRVGKKDESSSKKKCHRKVRFVLPDEVRRLPKQCGQTRNVGHD